MSSDFGGSESARIFLWMPLHTAFITVKDKPYDEISWLVEGHKISFTTGRHTGQSIQIPNPTAVATLYSRENKNEQQRRA